MHGKQVVSGEPKRTLFSGAARKKVFSVRGYRITDEAGMTEIHIYAIMTGLFNGQQHEQLN